MSSGRFLSVFLQELEFFFPSTIGHGPSNTAVYTDCTCCIIKPHAVAEGRGSAGLLPAQCLLSCNSHNCCPQTFYVSLLVHSRLLMCLSLSHYMVTKFGFGFFQIPA